MKINAVSYLTKKCLLAFSLVLSGLFVPGIILAQPSSNVNKEMSKTIGSASSTRNLLPNGWALSPAGTSLPLGDLPLNMALSHNRKMLAVTNNGQSKQSIQLIDPVSEKVLDQRSIVISWYGIKFSEDDNTLYVSGGNDNYIIAYDISNNKFGKTDTLLLGLRYPKENISPTGIEVDNDRNLLYTVTKENKSLYVYDLKSKQVLQKVPLNYEAYTCILSPDKTRLYVSLWGGDTLDVINTSTYQVESRVAVGSHPNEIVVTKNGRYVFVANANDNSVSVINTRTLKVIETISAAVFPTKLTGSTTNGLALSTDEKTLYIANADNNCLAVFNISVPGHSKSKGFIPTGWYPTNVKTIKNKILVSNGKGFSSMPNPGGPQPFRKSDNSGYHSGVTGGQVQYIGGLFTGTLSLIPVPTLKQLNTYSKQVYANTPFKPSLLNQAKGQLNNPIPRKPGDKSPIKYVFYIIKENRTYDQVLGDMAEGNGDTSLCLFPESVTPNHHALAREFVLLDNFYVDAEVSADGHNWSTAAYANDFVEKTWPINYGHRGGSYDYEGTRKIAFPRDGFIWDYCNRAGITYRSYGEFGEYGKASLKSLQGHVSPKYPGFNLNIKDVERFEIFKQDFDTLLAHNEVPQFNTIRLPNDHTSGQARGKWSPTAAVADNDLALGQMIQHISESSIWKESAIFVLEDDAQDGPDHVDAHRSPAFIISPYIKRKNINHNMYSTSGVLRTMELILGLPPMSQYDAGAVPLYECFTNIPDFTPYKYKDAQVNLDIRNTAANNSSKRSEMFDLTKEDSAPDLDLNEVVWKSVKGEHSVMPAPRRSAFIKLEEKRKDDDD